MLDEDPSIVNVRGRDGGTLLHRAAKYDRADVIDLLVHRKVDINVRNRVGSSAYHWAAGYGATSALRKLISEDETRVDDVNNYDVTPLMYAACYGRVECVKMLLLHKLNLRLKDEYGDTALDWARMWKRVEVIKLLEDV